MRKLNGLSLIFGLLNCLVAFDSHAQDPRHRKTAKKMLEIGWDMPNVAFLKANIQTVENQPFDGVIFKFEFPKHDVSVDAFSLSRTSEASISGQLNDLKSIQWQKYTDNFLMLYSGDPYTTRSFSWMNPAQMDTMVHNMELLSKVVAQAGVKGVMFDTENYFIPDAAADKADPTKRIHPWDYNTYRYPNHTYEQVSAQARIWGKAFMQALQKSKPDIKVLTTFFYDYTATFNKDDVYALARPFYDGMLDGITGEARIIAASEMGYFLTRTAEFPWLMNELKVNIPEGNLVDASVKQKYKDFVSCGSSTIVNRPFGIQYGQVGYDFNYGLSTPDKQKWFEHTIYHSLLNTDEYIWLYSQGDVNWWKDFPFKAEATASILKGKQAYQSRNALGYTIDDCSAKNGNNGAGFCFVNTGTDSLILNKPVFLSSNSVEITLRSNDQYAGWSNIFVNGIAIQKPTSFPYTLKMNNLKDGVYEVYALAYASSGKQFFSNSVAFETKTTTSTYVSENISIVSDVIKISPNPSNEEFKLEGQTEKIKFMAINNSQGVEQYRIYAFDKKFGADLQTGFYLAKVYFENGTKQTIKLFKQ